MSEPFRHRFRVRYAECDAQNIVFNANYFFYFDLLLTEMWREALGSYGAMIERGIDLVVGEANAQYFAPAHFDDEIDAAVTITRLGTTGVTTQYDLNRDGDLLVRGTMRHVVVDHGTHSKTPIPEWLRDALAGYLAADGQ
jgi:acyl-CoA thioester hydrolase